MSKRTSYTPGTFCWVDLSAHDMKTAGRFYADLLGWSVTEQDTAGGPPYAMFKRGEDVVAGMGQTSDEMKAQGVPPLWNSYVSVEDARATAKRVEALGGTVMFPVMDVMDAGAMTFVQDREGSVFAIWEPKQHHGATLVNEPGALCWNELYSRDLAAAQGFYGELFGWTFDSNEGPSGMKVTTIKNGDNYNGTIIVMDERMAGLPTHWATYFAVEDCDAAVATVKAKGGKVHMPPMDIPQGRLATVADPQGAVFVVMALAKPN